MRNNDLLPSSMPNWSCPQSTTPSLAPTCWSDAVARRCRATAARHQVRVACDQVKPTNWSMSMAQAVAERVAALVCNVIPGARRGSVIEGKVSTAGGSIVFCLRYHARQGATVDEFWSWNISAAMAH